jgi:hypothetical protein
MADVLLERTFDPPLTPDSVMAMATADEVVNCFRLHRVDWRMSLLALNGQQMVCWFQAPDAESARIALRKIAADTRRLWSGTVHDGPTDPDIANANVLVERSFATPVTVNEIQALEDAGAGCLQSYQVNFLRTFASLDGRRMLCLYQAPDAESVRLAQRRAGLPVDRVWSFKRIALSTPLTEIPLPLPR